MASRPFVAPAWRLTDTASLGQAPLDLRRLAPVRQAHGPCPLGGRIAARPHAKSLFNFIIFQYTYPAGDAGFRAPSVERGYGV